MSFLKLDGLYVEADKSLRDIESIIIRKIDNIEDSFGKDRWFSIGRTDIEKGFMALRKGVTEKNKSGQNQNG